MNTFINYVNGQVSLNTYRAPNATVTDFDDIVISLSKASEENLVCSVEGNELDVLCDGSYWNGSEATQEALEELHFLLSSQAQEVDNDSI